MIRKQKLILGYLAENCYLVWNSASGEGVVIDPGCEADKIIKVVEAEHIVPKAILLTHGHVDHIGAVPEIVEKYNVGLWLHPDEKDLYFSPANALPPWMSAVQGLPEPLKELPRIEGLDFQVFHTPGHTPGGVCYYFPNEKFILTGDTLFKGTYGRTDFPGGSTAAIMDSIKNILFKLPDDVVVHPGHEVNTTIGKEKQCPLYA